MKTYVAAEFDSVDLADLASHKVRRLNGIIGVEVTPNRFADQNRHSDGYAALPYAAPSGSPYGSGSLAAGFIGVIPSDTIPFDNRSNTGPEPSLRQDALLRVEVGAERTVKETSAVLRNTGGRNIQIIYR
jgi:hypothetical protein